MKTRILLLLICLITLGSSAARAQNQLPYDKNDPCLDAVASILWDSEVPGFWTNAAALEGLAKPIRRNLAVLLARIAKMDAEWNTTTAATRLEFVAELKRIKDCLPFLTKYLKAIEDQLKRLGVNSLVDDSSGRSDDVLLATYFRNARSDMTKLSQHIEAFIRKRG